jgi:hypothetical protein
MLLGTTLSLSSLDAARDDPELVERVEPVALV